MLAVLVILVILAVLPVLAVLVWLDPGAEPLLPREGA
jgi:hypothetical protein